MLDKYMLNMEINARDRKIIDKLKQNSRSTVRDIAKKTGIRPSTVHQRIMRMSSGGVIEKFTVKLDNKAAGENFIVFMQIMTKRDLPETFFADRHIKEVFGITGEYDLLLKLKFRDIEEFNKFVIGLRKNTSIAKTVTSIATITLKEEI